MFPVCCPCVLLVLSELVPVLVCLCCSSWVPALAVCLRCVACYYRYVYQPFFFLFTSPNIHYYLLRRGLVGICKSRMGRAVASVHS